jgi:hypothetical protein
MSSRDRGGASSSTRTPVSPLSTSETHLTEYFGVVARTSVLSIYDFGDDWAHDIQLND